MRSGGHEEGGAGEEGGIVRRVGPDEGGTSEEGGASAALPRDWTSSQGRRLSCTSFSSVHLLSCVQLFDSMECSMPDLPVHHQLSEFTQSPSSR